MIKKVFAALLVTTLSSAYCVRSVSAQPASNPEADLAKIYQKLDTAAATKNIDECLSVLSPNFMLLNRNGSVEDADGQRAHLTQIFSQFSVMDVTTTIEHCDYTDKTATVEIMQHVKATLPSTDGTKPTVFEGDLSARELWTKYPNGWEMDVAETLAGGQLTPDQR